MKSGFSLVELSIVLVILGLLTGGILAGQSLIRAAEIRNVAVEFNKYYTASQTFRDKYFAIPGDMTNAQSFWGIADATPANCKTTTSTTPLTCNGDGNGRILDIAAGSNEVFRFWQHLANAGLIEGTYTGVSDPPSPVSLSTRTGWNIPASKLSQAGWTVLYLDSSTVPTQVFDANNTYGNSFFFGTKFNFTSAAALTPEEAWNIDTKVDDGKGTRGRAVAWKNLLTPGCMSGDTDTDDYVLTNKSKACSMIFRQIL